MRTPWLALLALVVALTATGPLVFGQAPPAPRPVTVHTTPAPAAPPTAVMAVRSTRPAPPSALTRFRADLAGYQWPEAYALLPALARQAVPLATFADYLATPNGATQVLAHLSTTPAGVMTGWAAGFPATMKQAVTPLPSPPPAAPASGGTSPSVIVPTYLMGIYQWAASTTGVPWAILAAQDDVESGFHATETRQDANGTVDRGIAQINSGAHPTVTPAEAFNPWWAIPWQAQTLRRLYQESGNWSDALAIYNSGVPLAQVGPSARTQVTAYVHNILTIARTLSPTAP